MKPIDAQTAEALSWEHRPVYVHTPGIVLGPYEALVANLLWLDELVTGARATAMIGPGELLPGRIPISWQVRDRVLLTFLLYGHLDVLAAGTLVNRFLKARFNVDLSARDLFVALGPSEDEPLAHPFANSLQDLRVGVISADTRKAVLDVTQVTAVARAVARALRRAGLSASANDVHKRARGFLLSERQAAPDAINQALYSCVWSIERSIRQGIPLLSADAAAPYWGHVANEDIGFVVARVVWGEAAWLPRPTSFRQALVLNQDPRIADLRSSIIDRRVERGPQHRKISRRKGTASANCFTSPDV